VRTGAVVAVLSIATAGCIVDTTPARPASATLEQPSRTLVLSNGMRVVLQLAPDFGAATVASGAGAGAADDPQGKRGLAHFVEHLVCQSSHGGVSFWTAVFEGRANAYTTWDETIYHATTDLGALEQTIAVAYDAVVDPLGGVDDVVFQRQKRIVESEVRFSHVEQTQADEALWAAVFSPEHPYARPVGGTIDSVAGLSWADVTGFVDVHYRPENSVLAVVAPLSLADQQRMVERITGLAASAAAPGGPASAGPEAPSVDLPRSYSETTAPVASPRLLIGWSLPSSNKSGDLASLVARMLQGLTVELHKHDDDLSHVEAGAESGKRADLLTVRATLKEGTHVDRSARRVIDEVQGGLAKLAFEFDGFETMRAFYGSEMLYEQESLSTEATDAVWSTLRTGAPTFLAKRGDRLLAVGSDEVLGYVRTYLSPARAHVVLIRPGPPPPAVDSHPELVPAVLRAPVEAPAHGPPIPAAAPTPPRPLLAGLEQHVLSNGLPVVLFQRPGSKFHTVLLGFRGGLAEAAPAGVTVAASWARHRSHQSPRIFGIIHDDWVDASDTLERLRGIGPNLDVTLGYLREQLGFSVFWPPKNFTDRVTLFEHEAQMPSQRLTRRMARALLGDTPLGIDPTAEQIQKITPAELNRWLSRVRQPSNSLLVMVGDFDPQAALAAAEKELGGWGARAAPATPPAAPPVRTELDPSAERLVVVHQPGATHATLQFECLLPKVTAENWGGRRVFENGVYAAVLSHLREKLGSTYAVSDDHLILTGGTDLFRLWTDVDYPLLPDALRWLGQNLTGPGQGFVGRDRVEAIKATTIRDLQIDGASSEGWAGSLLWTWSQSWPLDLRDRLPAAVAEVTRDVLDQLADHCRANGVVGLLGDEARLRRAWEQATR
jgi:zinc protease